VKCSTLAAACHLLASFPAGGSLADAGAMKQRLLAASLVILLGQVHGLHAQTSTSAAGRWEGAIKTPGKDLPCVVVLWQSGNDWHGTIDSPAQNVKGYPLSSIVVQGESVTFTMKGVRGNPVFKGKLSKDGASLAGDFTQGRGSAPFALKRAAQK
jgi:hypothetical protein